MSDEKFAKWAEEELCSGIREVMKCIHFINANGVCKYCNYHEDALHEVFIATIAWDSCKEAYGVKDE